MSKIILRKSHIKSENNHIKIYLDAWVTSKSKTSRINTSNKTRSLMMLYFLNFFKDNKTFSGSSKKT